MTDDREMPAATRQLELYAGGLSIAAAVVHGLVVPEHLAEWWGYGLFFFGATLVQGGYGILLFLQPWRYDTSGGFDPEQGQTTAARLYWIGIAINVSIIALYVVTRTIGIPVFGPEAGEVEEITAISALSKAIEVVLVGVLVVALRRGQNATGRAAVGPKG